MNPTSFEYFEQRVFKPETPCWIWRAYVGKKGYGLFVHDGHRAYAHRAAYELFVGPIPDGMDIHHRCFNRQCVNPDHLEPTTRVDNIRSSPRFPSLKTHCKHGHEFTPENTWRDARGHRQCLTCKREFNRRFNQRKRENRGPSKRELYCKNGHLRTAENTRETRTGGVTCITCEQENYKATRLKPGGYLDPNRKRATHCPKGHEFTPENTYTAPNGRYRYCRTCNREKARLQAAKRRTA